MGVTPTTQVIVWIVGALVSALISLAIESLLGWSFGISFLAISLILAGCLFVWHEQAEKSRAAQSQESYSQLRKQFLLFKQASDLEPKDFGFTSTWQRFSKGRPFTTHYQTRRFTMADSNASISESDVLTHLRNGEGVILLGQPTEGKTRTAFELIRALEDWIVIRPRKDLPVPPPETFSELVRLRNVVLFLDNLNDYSEFPLDLVTLCDREHLRQSGKLAILSTCRDGTELSVVSRAMGSGLSRFYSEHLALKLKLIASTNDEKRDLLRMLGRPFTELTPEKFATLGQILMEEGFRFQKERFLLLSEECQDLVKAIQLMVEGGIIPLTKKRLTFVMDDLFHRRDIHLDDLLKILNHQSFLTSPVEWTIVEPEYAYLDPNVTGFDPSRDSRFNFRQLLQAFYDSNDLLGVFLLSITIERLDKQSELGNLSDLAWERAFTLGQEHLARDSTNVIALLAISAAYQRQNNWEGVMEAADSLLAIVPEDNFVLELRALSLNRTNRFDEALEVSNKLLVDDHDNRMGLLQKSIALANLSRWEESLEPVSRLLQLYPMNKIALTIQANALAHSLKWEEVIDTVELMLSEYPEDIKVHELRVRAHFELQHWEEACESAKQCLHYHPTSWFAHMVRSLSLTILKRFDEAIASVAMMRSQFSHDELPDMITAIVLGAMDDLETAVAFIDSVIASRPDDELALDIKARLVNKSVKKANSQQADSASTHIEHTTGADVEQIAQSVIDTTSPAVFPNSWPTDTPS